MDFHFPVQTPLFAGVTETEAKEMFKCLNAVHKNYGKDEVICRMGDRIHALGLVLSGGVTIESDDVWGNKTILDHVGPGQVFAEAYSCLPQEPLMVNVTAAQDSEILFLELDRLLTVCPSACQYHSRLIHNLLSVLARKNLNLTRKIFHTSPRTIRERLLSYLSFQALRQGSSRFEIPFNRQQLADYLEVDRSALSNELSKMRREGLLTCERNRFCLKETGTGAFNFNFL